MLIVLCLVLLVATAMLLVMNMRERAERHQRNLSGDWPIEPISLEQVDPVFRQGPFGAGLQTEVAFIGKGPLTVEGGTSDAEAWILAVLAKNAHRLFEFGTCTGKTTYLWARNSPPDAQITTLTLAPDARSAYRHESSDAARDSEAALSESGHVEFLYSGSAVEAKVEQLFGDSKTLDVTTRALSCDLVFVDGSHAYSYVVSDSEKALQLVRPGGLVLWHDYAGPKHSPGVYRALNELAARLPLHRIVGTSLVAYRKPVIGAV